MPRRKTISDPELLDALLPVVLRCGVHRVTLAELGAVVGLSAATLIQRFGTRQRLLDAVLDRSTVHLEVELATVRHHGADQQPQPAWLFAWLAERTDPIADRELLAGNLGVLARDVSDPERRHQARRHQALIRERIRRSLRGAAVPSDRVEDLAATIEAHWHGLVIQWALTGEGSLSRAVEMGLWRLWQGLAVEGAG